MEISGLVYRGGPHTKSKERNLPPMICEHCNKVEADILYHEAYNEHPRTYWLCKPCAEAMAATGELSDISAAVVPYDSPLLPTDPPPPLPPVAIGSVAIATTERPDTPPEDVSEEYPKTTCPLCGTTSDDISATGAVGCALCYRTFRGILGTVLRSLHGTEEHHGRISAGHRAKRERLERLHLLRESLKEAVLCEHYEDAATLRDEIRRVEAEVGGV